ncbi:MAG: glycosyltransferase, partial [Solirubrobacterales bacterium]
AAQETLLIGGEVLMHPDFHGICEYAHSFGGSLRMTTNLHTLAGDREEAVGSFIHELKVSIDAATKRTYESIRTHLNFDRLLENLDIVSKIRRRRSDLGLSLTCVVMRQNIEELPGVIELASRYGFDGVAVNFVQTRCRVGPEDSLLFHRELANRYFDLARQRAAALGMPLTIPENFDLTRSPFVLPEQTTEAYRSCLRPWQRVRVLVTGEVVPCCHLQDLPVGNVLTQSFDEIWDGPTYQGLREAIRTGSEKMPQRCKHCQLLGKKTDSNDAMLHISPDQLEAMKTRLVAAVPSPTASPTVPPRPSMAFPSEVPPSRQAGDDPRPKVSVIMACHNAAAYLAECLDSLRNQTLQEWELLLVDDGSTDKTHEILDQYRHADSRIHVFCFERNEGPYVRRRWAIPRANSDFIVIQDADDLMHPSKLERLYSEIAKDPRLAAVGSQYRTFIHEFRGEQHTELIPLSMNPDEIVEKCITWGHPFSHACAVIRREMFEHIGPYDGNPFGADSFWSAKLGEYIRHGAPWTLRNIPDCLTFVRIHGANQTQQLPAFDSRGRRARYLQYCECKLRAIREAMRNTPDADWAAELRRCDCSDFLVRFKAMILKWESEPLAPGALPILLNKGLRYFDEGYFVSCVSLLNRIEVMQPDIAGRVVNFDLLRAMALYSLDLREQSRTHARRELENHDDSAAREFLAEYLDGNAKGDLRQWRKTRVDHFLMAVAEAAPVYNNLSTGPRTRESTSEIYTAGR